MPIPSIQDAQISLGTLQDEMSRFVERVWHGGVSTKPFDGQNWAPAVDLYEYPDHYVLYAEIPGVALKDVEVTHVGPVLTLRGSRVCPVGEDEGTATLRNERRFGGFCRKIDLPGDVDTDRLSAKCQDGVLEVKVHKQASSMPRAVKIEVQEG